MEIEADELNARLGEVALIDVRNEAEYAGAAGYPCDSRQGHIPTARHLALDDLMLVGSSEELRELVGEPEGAEVVVYCHSGGRSAIAVQILRSAGYQARNYAGSGHEWSRRDDLPAA
jgi:thiosulfate/3-mercaptopyruvate sulfurtransferase